MVILILSFSRQPRGSIPRGLRRSAFAETSPNPFSGKGRKCCLQPQGHANASSGRPQRGTLSGYVKSQPARSPSQAPPAGGLLRKCVDVVGPPSGGHTPPCGRSQRGASGNDSGRQPRRINPQTMRPNRKIQLGTSSGRPSKREGLQLRGLLSQSHLQRKVPAGVAVVLQVAVCPGSASADTSSGRSSPEGRRCCVQTRVRASTRLHAGGPSGGHQASAVMITGVASNTLRACQHQLPEGSGRGPTTGTVGDPLLPPIPAVFTPCSHKLLFLVF